jgi:predicted oxidoreductase (fatty acid repression mutant protein)
VSTVPDAKLRSIVEDAVMYTPSPFNMQAGRAIVVTGNRSDSLWEKIVKPGHLKTLGDDGKDPSAGSYNSMLKIIDRVEASIKVYTQKISEYAAGYGTVLFFEDQAIVNAMSAKIRA